MKKLLFPILLFVLPGLLLAQEIDSTSADTLSNNFYFEPVSDTIPDLNIFETETPLNITLKYDITSFIKNKDKGEYQDAVLQIHYDDNQIITKNIKLKARGNYRRDNCIFPPIHLNFKSDPIENSELTEKIKLVTHCNSAKSYQNYILKEYLAYKLYNVLSEFSFRVRLLNISYLDTGKKKKNYETVGFLIEPIEILAERKGSIIVDPVIIRKDDVIEEYADQVALFQYMIANTDWRIKGGHNTKYIKPLNLNTSRVIPVPYDFDFSGFVGTSYSFPQSWTSIESVGEREYLGYCRDNDKAYFSNIEKFDEKSEEIFETIGSCVLLSEKEKEKLSKFLLEFYDRVSKPDRFIRTLKNQCRTDF